MKFKANTKGFITQAFYGSERYKLMVGHPHTGIDSHNGYGSYFRCDNAGLIYKVYKEGDRQDNWCAVYQLVQYTNIPEVFMEICTGHFSKVYAKKGQNLPEDCLIGLEGNKGLIFAGGVKITPEMQRAGDRRGSHTHTQYRPVFRVNKITAGKHYLRNERGGYHKDEEGLYYQILHTNKLNGCIDPMSFNYEDKITEKLDILSRLLKYLFGRWSALSASK